MDELFSKVQTQGRITFVMLQLPGLEAHSWLITRMKKSKEGYSLGVVDSNLPNLTYTVEYKFGDSHLKDGMVGEKFVPYTEFEEDLDKILATLKGHCGQTPKLGSLGDETSPIKQLEQALRYSRAKLCH